MQSTALPIYRQAALFCIGDVTTHLSAETDCLRQLGIYFDSIRALCQTGPASSLAELGVNLIAAREIQMLVWFDGARK
jgi:hypothetical protein